MSLGGWAGQFIRFVLVGVVNTVAGLGTIFALIAFAGFPDLPANASGYAVGLCCSFVLNRSWTFRHQGRWQAALVRFLLVFALAYSVNLVTLFLLADYLSVNRFLAHALATIPYTLVFFLVARQFAFKSNLPLLTAERTEGT